MTGVVVWFTGLPSSGKTTLAKSIQERLVRLRRSVCLLDSDEIREALVPSPGYTEQGRNAFYATLAGLAALLSQQGLVVLVAATAHRGEHRERAREAAPSFIEVWVNTPIEECERRDPKKLYARARQGDLTSLPGVQLQYEIPAQPDIVASGGLSAAAVDEILQRISGVAA